MKRKRISAVAAMTVAGFVILASVMILTAPAASAQSITAIGEITARGDVFLASSDGKWVRAEKTYPLLQNTAIKTEDGSASLYFKDSSRIALTKNTIAYVGSSPAGYSAKVSQGRMAFTVKSSTSLTVETPTATVYVNRKKGEVRTVSLENSSYSMGVITVSDEGTEVRSVSGSIVVQVSSSEIKPVGAGESMFIGPDNAYKVYEAQAVGAGAGSSLLPVLILGADLAAMAEISWGMGECVYCGSGHASPSSPARR